jgi:L-2,4-diaminobutyric acid acetyltransferase
LNSIISTLRHVDEARAPASVLAIRRPRASDGQALHELIASCPPLDRNSLYCNLLQATHFGDTAAVAELEGEMVGSVTGYLMPQRKDTLFIWQVSVDERARGRGLAKRLIRHILGRSHLEDVRRIETTIEPDNAASWGLFTSLAQDLDAPANRQTLFDRDLHFGGAHNDEILLRIGPFGAGFSTNYSLSNRNEHVGLR